MNAVSSRSFKAARKGDWIQTATDKQFWPMDPRVEDVCLEDIAHGLSNLCRFGGHVRSFYSVAQHSVLVARHLPAELQLAGLLHDATEAYLIDVPRPIKRFLSEYAAIEHGLAVCIGAKFNVSLEPLPPRVHVEDERALYTEKRDLKGRAPAPWSGSAEPWPEVIVPWSPEMAKATFIGMAHQLGIR